MSTLEGAGFLVIGFLTRAHNADTTDGSMIEQSCIGPTTGHREQDLG
jgi:hypothetical protein